MRNDNGEGLWFLFGDAMLCRGSSALVYLSGVPFLRNISISTVYSQKLIAVTANFCLGSSKNTFKKI